MNCVDGVFFNIWKFIINMIFIFLNDYFLIFDIYFNVLNY